MIHLWILKNKKNDGRNYQSEEWTRWDEERVVQAKVSYSWIKSYSWITQVYSWLIILLSISSYRSYFKQNSIEGSWNPYCIKESNSVSSLYWASLTLNPVSSTSISLLKINRGIFSYDIQVILGFLP